MLSRAWPAKWDGPDLNAEGNDVAIETLEMAHEGVERPHNRRSAVMFQTEIEFTLPCGYLDQDGTLHREGLMRRATAADEILPLKDPRVQKNPAYLVVILFSRVITRLEGVDAINPKVIEGLYATDLAYLQDLYNDLNRLNGEQTLAVCPQCGHELKVEANSLGGS